MLTGGAIGLALAATQPALALTGARQGCLAVINGTGKNLIVHVRRASVDGDYRLPADQEMFVDPDRLRVSEDSMVGADAAGKKYPLIALKADPTAEYSADLRSQHVSDAPPRCTAGWAKTFVD